MTGEEFLRVQVQYSIGMKLGEEDETNKKNVREIALDILEY